MALRPSTPKSRSDQLAERAKAQDEVFLREVDDAMRDDQLQTAMRRYGIPLALVLVAGLAALAGWLWYDARRDDDANRAGERFVVALDQIEAGRIEQGSAGLAPLAAGDSDGYRAASRLMLAGLAVEQDRAAEAQRLLAEVAADKDAPEPYRELATVREVALRFDTMKPEDVIARLKPLAEPGNPWFGSAGELVGAAYLKQGRNDLAGPLFAAIAKDPAVPDSLRSRARQMAGVLGVDAVTDAEQALGTSPVAAAEQPSARQP